MAVVAGRGLDGTYLVSTSDDILKPTARGQELLRRPLLHDAPQVHDDNPISKSRRAQPVGYEHCSASSSQRGKALEQSQLSHRLRRMRTPRTWVFERGLSPKACGMGKDPGSDLVKQAIFWPSRRHEDPGPPLRLRFSQAFELVQDALPANAAAAHVPRHPDRPPGFELAKRGPVLTSLALPRISVQARCAEV